MSEFTGEALGVLISFITFGLLITIIITLVTPQYVDMMIRVVEGMVV